MMTETTPEWTYVSNIGLTWIGFNESYGIDIQSSATLIRI
jgi:hypothetical protein